MSLLDGGATLLELGPEHLPAGMRAATITLWAVDEVTFRDAHRAFAGRVRAQVVSLPEGPRVLRVVERQDDRVTVSVHAPLLDPDSEQARVALEASRMVDELEALRRS